MSVKNAAAILTAAMAVSTFPASAAPADSPKAVAATEASIQFTETIYVGKSAHEVWEGITDPKIVSRYFMAPLVELDLKPGGVIRYATKKGDIMTGHVLAFEKDKMLKHTFNFVGMKDPESEVTYTIEAIGPEMCSLTLTHTGLTSREGTYEHISFGWPWMLSRMKTLLETGKVLRFPD